MSIERNQEIKGSILYRDSRTLSKKISDWLTYPLNFRNACGGYIAFCLVFPMLIIPTLFISLLIIWWWIWQPQRLPLRIPKWIDLKDPSSLEDKAETIRKGAGIEHLGNERKGQTVRGGDELWTTDSDIRVHRLVMATTGGGKTNTLLSWMINPLCWGSGFMYADGKAQNTLWVDIYVMADTFWRVDDLLVINYMMGGHDQFDEVAKGKRGQRKRRSNTMNPFGKANNDTIDQLLGSLMPKASGDSMTWQSKAMNMMSGVTQVSCYLRAKRESLVSVKTLRDNMSLQNMIKLSQRTDLPEIATSAIKAYLNVGLPGFNAENAKNGKPQAQTTLDQHGYLTGQYTRTLGLLANTYSHIFLDTLPEVDMPDVVLNNRILCVMIPTLEMSVEQAGNLGKLVVAATKMMMATNLGSDVEGNVEDIVKNRPTNTPVPYEVVLDELGYYFADGIDLMFAQGRSLGMGLTASGQDFQAMAKENKNQVESMIANTGLKVALKTEDPKETFEVFSKAAGEAFVTRVSGFESEHDSLLTNNFKSDARATIEKQGRISLEELRALAPGDGVILFKERVIRASMLDIFNGKKALKRRADLEIKLNVMLPIDMPQFHEISQKCQKSDEDMTTRIMSLMLAGAPPAYPEDGGANPVLMALSAAARKMPSTIPPVERGIVLFMAASRAIKQQKALAEGKGNSGNAQILKPEYKPDDPLAFLNEPPFDVETTPAQKPQEHAWAKTGADAMSEVIGIEQNSKPSVSLKPQTAEVLTEIMSNMTPGGTDEETAFKEINSVECAITSACEPAQPDAGKETNPPSFGSVDDLMTAFDQIEQGYQD